MRSRRRGVVCGVSKRKRVSHISGGALVSFGRSGQRPGGALCDLAPTLLELMGVVKPGEMTGKSLLSHP